MAVRPQRGHSCDLRAANFYDTTGWTGDEKYINQRVLAIGDEWLQRVTHLNLTDCLKRSGEDEEDSKCGKATTDDAVGKMATKKVQGDIKNYLLFVYTL